MPRKATRETRSSEDGPPAAQDREDGASELATLGHERWLRLWRGTLALLQREEPRAYRRVMVALERHRLAGPTMHFRAKEGRVLPYTETGMLGMPGVVTDDFRGQWPTALVTGILDRVRAFEQDPTWGDYRGSSVRGRAVIASCSLPTGGRGGRSSPTRRRASCACAARRRCQSWRM